MYKGFKWVMDRLLAFIAVCALTPLFLLLSLLIVLDSKGSPFFVQKRDGYKKKIIKVVKFRTMFRADFAFDVDHPVIESSDEKVTRVGRVLRRTKLDELPQLFNILIADMSFIGPRPLLPAYTPRYERWEFQKFAVKPGLTGLSQVRGNGYLSVKSRSYYDALYTEKISLWTDTKILFMTIGVIFRGEKAFLKEAAPEEIEEMKRRYQPTEGGAPTQPEQAGATVEAEMPAAGGAESLEAAAASLSEKTEPSQEGSSFEQEKKDTPDEN